MAIKDAIDDQLIRLLGKDGRLSSNTLSKQIKVSSTTVRRRVRKLIRDGVLRIVAVVDPKKIGLPLTTIIAFNVAREQLNSTTKWLSSQPNIKWVSTTTGRYDILALAQFSSTDDLSEFLNNKVASIEGLKNTETFICLHTDKMQYIQVV